MNGHLFTILGAVVTLVFMFELLRRRRLREKYAGLWIVVALLVVVAAAFPVVTERLSSLVGITTPVNLVFFLGLLALLVVCVQLSAELSEIEHETQTLAEQAALLRLRIERLEDAAARGGPGEDAAAGPDA